MPYGTVHIKHESTHVPFLGKPRPKLPILHVYTQNELSRQGETRQQNSSSETSICVPSTVLGEAFHGQAVVRPLREDWYGGADEKLSGKAALSMDRHERGMILPLLYENFLTLNRQ